MDKPRVTIYTDGGADPNPGPGGWGVVLLFVKDGKTHKKELKGGETNTTNNRMELTAAIEALKALKQSCVVELFTDSQYLCNGITDWMPGWKKNNFKKGKILNSDLWQALDTEVSRHDIQWQWVKGHANNEYNERADALADAGRAEVMGHPISEDAIDNPYYVRLAVADPAWSGAGAWVAVLVKGDQKIVLSGQEDKIGANRLYLLGAIAVLETLSDQETIYILTNSDYLRDGIKGWLKAWKQNNWHTREGTEVKNRDLWEKLDRLLQSRHVKVSSIDNNDPEFISIKKIATEMLKKNHLSETDT